MAVLDPPRIDRLERAILPSKREGEPIDAVAGLDDVEQAAGIAGADRAPIEIAVDEVEHAASVRHAGHLRERWAALMTICRAGGASCPHAAQADRMQGSDLSRASRLYLFEE